MRKCTSRGWCRRVSRMPRIIWFLRQAMPTTRRLTKETVLPRFRRFATSTRDIGSVAGRRMRWTSTICCSTHSCCSGTTPRCWRVIEDQFRYILVDEYRDTNFAQHSIVLQLAKNHQHVCVVGDDAQSIYSFRGADIDNILYFTKVYPDTKVFKLEQNYRSTQTIVRAANSPIEKNQWQIRKEVFSEKEKGEAIGVYQAYSDVEEGDIVVNKIAELRREKRYAYSDFCDTLPYQCAEPYL